MQDFRNLKVWREGHDLALELYRVSARFPNEEAYGLRAQLRRAAVSVPANIVEGTARGSDADTRRFLGIALGSAGEVECLVLICHDLGLLTTSQRDDLGARTRAVRKMLNAFITRLRPGPARRGRRAG